MLANASRLDLIRQHKRDIKYRRQKAKRIAERNKMKSDEKEKPIPIKNDCGGDPFDLKRFKKAQEGEYEIAFDELKNGRKESHWMWYIFPQIKGLGESGYSEYYGLSGLNEAKAYYEDELLGSRLIALCNLLLRFNENDAVRIFGPTDSKKLKSSMTIFYLASKDETFKEVLNKYFDGELDSHTITKIETKPKTLRRIYKMAEIKCPNCGEIIKLDKSSYDALLNEIEKEEIEKRLTFQTKQIEEKYKAQYALKINEQNNSKDKEISDLKNNISLLNEKLKGNDKDVKLAVAKALEDVNSKLSKKDQEIAVLKGQIDSNKKDGELTAQKLKEHYESELKDKEELIERWKNFRMGDSTKDLGESLEQYCKDKFDQARAVSYPRAYFEKDNDSSSGSKGDFIFRDFSEDGTEIVSIMFEMKNQKDDTEHKHKNEDFFKKLDKDRTEKGCEYAILVSTLEENSDLYNTGIVDVSYRYPKMYVVRPSHFMSIIGLLRNMALNSLSYKQQVIAYQRENVDITNFEKTVRAVADKINTDYENAGKIYGEVDKMCDDIVNKVEKFRKEFKTATGWIEKAKNQLPNLEVRKLTKGNPTMKEKFEDLEKKD